MYMKTRGLMHITVHNMATELWNQLFGLYALVAVVGVYCSQISQSVLMLYIKLFCLHAISFALRFARLYTAPLVHSR